MKVVVYWGNDSERTVAERMARVVGSLLQSVANTIWRDMANDSSTRPSIEVSAESVMDYSGMPYSYPPEVLAAQAERLLAEQEAAFAEKFTAAVEYDKKVLRNFGGSIVRAVQ